jgi:hypothetical protein
LIVEDTGRVAYQHTISVALVATPLKRSTVVFVATLTMRYVPGWVLNGRMPEAVEVGALEGHGDAEEAVEVSEEVSAVEDAEDVVDIEVREDVADDEELAVKEGDEAEDIEVSEDFKAEDNVNDEENVNAEEDVELADEEKTELVDCCCCSCCWGVGTCLPLYATKSAPPKPPPIAPPNTTSTSANAIQNVRVGSPHM